MRWLPRPRLALVVVAAGLATWLLWPEKPAPKPLPLWRGPIPATFRVTTGAVIQHVGRGLVVRASEPAQSSEPAQPGRSTEPDRPTTQPAKTQRVSLLADAQAISGLWITLGQVEATPDKILSGISATAAMAYGCNGAHEIRGPGVWLRWGRGTQVEALWDGETKRLAALRPGMAARLDAAAERLDARKPITAVEQAGRILHPAGVLLNVNGQWTDPERPLRPAPRAAITGLARLAGAIEINSLAMISLPAPSASVVISGAADRRRIDLHPGFTGLDGWLTVNGGPAQRLDREQWLRWRVAVDRLQRDTLMPPLALDDLTSVVLPNATLIRRLQRATWEAPWNVQWRGGREPADPAAVQRLLDVLQRTVVSDLQPGPLSSTIASVRFTTNNGDVSLDVAPSASGGWLLGDEHRHGLIAGVKPRWIELAVEALLDPHVLAAGPRRIERWQREELGAEPRPGEIFARDDAQRWRRIWPASAAIAISASSGEAWARHLSTLTGTDQGVPSAADRAIIAAPQLRVLVRVAPFDPERPADDEHGVHDTVGWETGWALSALPSETENNANSLMNISAKAWRMVDLDGRRARTISAAAVAELRRAMTGAGVVAVLPGDLLGISAELGTERWQLTRTGDRWLMTAAAGSGTGTTAPHSVASWAIARVVRALGEPPNGGDAVVTTVAGRLTLQRNGAAALSVLVQTPDPAGRCGVSVDGQSVGWVNTATAHDLLPSRAALMANLSLHSSASGAVAP